MSKYLKLEIVSIGILILLLIISVISKKPAIHNQTHKLTVVTTLFPLYDFTRNIGQDKVDVRLLLPPGVEAHDYDPTPSDVVRINEADIFIYTGKFMEVWANRIINGVTNHNLKIIDASKGINLLTINSRLATTSNIDPHIWMDFTNSEIIVNSITVNLSQSDPKNRDYYTNNAKLYIQKLNSLDQKYQQSLMSCLSREIIFGGHYAFGYLAREYNLTYQAAMGLSPDSEPTANDLSYLVNQIKTDGIKYVFYEELASPKIAETLVGETGVKLIALNSAHNISKTDLGRGVTFLSIMENNLTNLKIGLGCN